ncbi:EcsC family protein [Mariniradius sediminis]|uniref:EcsC family protein n=1 Tax=Mariniradius sediminis TaxID=2909237 RepID=A0ABS9BSF6_9BACT|nr:EcsC family protein [Mariniradius sediminis]MCF1750289.1 EcsC family protein [Mariniradius sediminis]
MDYLSRGFFVVSGMAETLTDSFVQDPFYEEKAMAEMSAWLAQNKQKPAFLSRLTKITQSGINELIPEKVHQVVTYAIEKMVKGVLLGTKFITPAPLQGLNLQQREAKVEKIIRIYQNTASVEGAVTGAGGILLGLADFPAFLTIKMKMLFEIAAAYGYDVRKFEERLYILYVFKITFSSQHSRNRTIGIIENWDEYVAGLPPETSDFDWRDFQLEYRDYLDLAKLVQLIPIIGAPVGAVANYKLSAKLGHIAKQCYRMRHFKWDV